MKSQYLFAILGIFLIAFMCCEARYIRQMRTAKRETDVQPTDLENVLNVEEFVGNSLEDDNEDNYKEDSDNELKETTTKKVPIPRIAPSKVDRKTVKRNPVSVNQGSQHTGWGGSVNPGNNGGSANLDVGLLSFVVDTVIKDWDQYRKSSSSKEPLYQFDIRSPEFQAHLNDPRNTVGLEREVLNLFQSFDSNTKPIEYECEDDDHPNTEPEKKRTKKKLGWQQASWGGSVNPGNNGGSTNSDSGLVTFAMNTAKNMWDTYRKSSSSKEPLNQYEFMSPEFQAHLNDPRNTVGLEREVLNLFQYFE